MRQARQDELGKAFARQMPFDFVRLGTVVAEGRAEAHRSAAARRHDGLVQSLAARRARAGAADQRLAGQRQARHGQAQIQSGIADDDDASPPLVFLVLPPPAILCSQPASIPVHYGRGLQEDLR